jgi:hypothetical protein
MRRPKPFSEYPKALDKLGRLRIKWDGITTCQGHWAARRQLPSTHAYGCRVSCRQASL